MKLTMTSEPAKPIVDLIWSFGEEEGSGIGPSYLIVAWPTGILYTNQTNGHGCSQPSQEGFLAPLLVPIDFDRFNPVGWGSLSPEDAERADEALAAARVPFFSPFSQLGYTAQVNRERLAESTEAWIWLTLTRDPSQPPDLVMLQGLPETLEAVWTYQNSD